MAIIAGTYDFTVQRRADHTESIRITDSNDSPVNLTGFTIAAQVWNKDRTGKYAEPTPPPPQNMNCIVIGDNMLSCN